MRRALEALLRSTLRPPVTQLAAPRPVPPTRNPEEPKAKMEGLIQQIEKAAVILRRPNLRIVNWDNSDRITHGDNETVDYPSVEELVKAFAGRREAEKEYSATNVVCEHLRIDK